MQWHVLYYIVIIMPKCSHGCIEISEEDTDTQHSTDGNILALQLCLFAQQRFNHVNYLWDTKISFSHLFIRGWDSSREINVYPPGSGPLAVYKKSEFYNYLDYAVIGVSQFITCKSAIQLWLFLLLLCMASACYL